MSGAPRSRSSSACSRSWSPKILSVNIVPKTPPMTPAKSALQIKFLKEIILFVALIVPRKTLELCLFWWSLYVKCICATRLIIFTEDVDFRGRESEIEDRGSGSVKVIKMITKIAEINIRNLRIYFHVNFYALSSNHLREQFLDYG